LNLSSELKKKCKECCSRFRIDRDIYIIGVHQRPITAYKQQVRALNLFFSLKATNKHINKKNPSVLVIGAGISGITFADACLKAGIEVWLVEKREGLIPLQSHCDKRDIHPHLYDWPDEGSLEKNAGLPIMNWDGGKASDVAQTLIKEFELTQEKIQNPIYELLHYNPLLNQVTNIVDKQSYYEFDLGTNEPPIDGTTFSKPESFRCDVIIFATGYGVEKSINYPSDQKTPSYWSDTDYDQPEKGQPKPFFISGSGDGAFADLFATTITGFKYNKLVEILKNHPNRDVLEPKLKQIKKLFFSTKDKPKDFLYKQFKSQIKFQLYEPVAKELLLRRIPVTFNCDNDDFKEALNLDKISMVNAFIAFILLEKGHFTFQSGRLEYNDVEKRWNIPDNYNPILRHGADRHADFLHFKHLLAIIEGAKFVKKQTKDDKEKDQPIFTKNGFLEIFNNSKQDLTVKGVSGNAHALMINYICSISNAIEAFIDQKIAYRITLHKVKKVNDSFYYQQVTPYSSKDTFQVKKLSGGFSKTHPIETGSVGYSIVTGKCTMVYNDSNSSEFTDLLKIMGLDEHKDRFKETKVFFTLPLSAPTSYYHPINHERVQGSTVNLVLYIDTNSKDLFNNKSFTTFLYNMTCTFVENINLGVKEGLIKSDKLDFEPSIHTKTMLTTNVEKTKLLIDHPFVNFIRNNRANLTLTDFNTFSQSN
jgi:hypothetical protein